MTDRTLDYYDQNSLELSRRYESTALDSFHRLLNKTMPPGAKLLEIGCGSGRDAARAAAVGFDLVALDGSQSLLVEAEKLHPELSGRLHLVRLPGVLPLQSRSFDGFFSVACLMHFRTEELPEIINELARVVKHSGHGLISVPTGRSDIDAQGLDQHGRVFNLMPTTDWQKIFAHCGFAADVGPEEPDSLGRPGINWVTFLLQRK